MPQSKPIRRAKPKVDVDGYAEYTAEQIRAAWAWHQSQRAAVLARLANDERQSNGDSRNDNE